MKAYLFPGQGSQFPGMAKDLYDKSAMARTLFKTATTILGFDIADIMFEGSEEDLRQTKVTQPAIFLHSVILSRVMGKAFCPDMVAGHSLGEFSALAAARGISFENGLQLVYARAMAMQNACEQHPSTMAAIIGLDDQTIQSVCNDIEGIVVPANYNAPGQIVISGSNEAVLTACEKLKETGAKRAIPLQVGGAFHSPLMEPARAELQKTIEKTSVIKPVCPIYQNVNAQPTNDPGRIKKNLIAQLTSPVHWSQTIYGMIRDGAASFTEVGPGRVLLGLVKKIDRRLMTASAAI